MNDMLNYLKLDEYDQKAVFEPAIVNLLFLTMVIVFAFWHLLPFGAFTKAILTIVPIIFFAIVIRYIMDVFRMWSKLILQYPRYKRNMTNMPTTEMLMWKNNEISYQEKKKIRDKIYSKYGIKLNSAAKEQIDEEGSRQLIAEAVSRIRRDIRNNPHADSMYLRYNIRYGKDRNFLGGATICIVIEAVLASTASVTKEQFLIIPAAIIVVHLVLMVIDYFSIPSDAKEFAANLYNEFLNLN